MRNGSKVGVSNVLKRYKTDCRLFRGEKMERGDRRANQDTVMRAQIGLEIKAVGYGANP